MLSERRAWLYLAKKWDKAKPPKLDGWEDDVEVVIRLNRFGEEIGLCDTIVRLPISCSVCDAMEDKVDRERRRLKKRRWAFLWPTTKAGAKKRAAFCRRMAKLCE